MSEAARATARAAEPAVSPHGPLLRLQRQCACGAGKPGLAADCEGCRRQKLSGGQPKLAVGAADDRFEREADQVAERVLAGGHAAPGAAAPLRLQRVDSGGSDGLGEAPAEVQQVTGAPARGLDAAARTFFETRFGHDFSRVRVHDDAAADRSARAVGARAYTVGQDLVFAAGQYLPHSATGRRLLAHELAHVVQQRGGAAAVQRAPKTDSPPPPATKTDVSIVLSGDDQDMFEGSAYAKTVLRVTDVDDAAAKLKALGVPIGRLFVVSHSNAAGQVEFTSSIGTIHWVPIADLAKTLKGAASIDDVDFRGCKTGDAPAAMENFRQGVGAKSVRGSSCWTFIQHATPLTYDGVDVTKPSQIPKGRQHAYDKALLQQLANMKASNGVAVQNCLLGLDKGEKAGSATLAKVWKLYWANGGNLVASWGSPAYNHDWQEGSICSKDMTADTKPCAMVETKAPAATAAPAGGKTGALENTRQGVPVDAVAEADAEVVDVADDGEVAQQSEEVA